MQQDLTDKNNVIHLAEFNLNVIKIMLGLGQIAFSEKAKEKILQHDWSVNVLELEQVIEKAAQGCKNGMIEPDDIELNHASLKTPPLPVGLKLEDLERNYILQTLYFVQQNRTRAAEALGISIRTLRNKINQYRLEGFL